MFDSLKFVLKNLNRLKENPHYSYWKTLALINNVINGKIKDDVILNNKQKAFMIDFFIETNRILDNKTPDFIKEDHECIKSSIKNDANSIKYAKLIDDEIKSFAINEAIRQEIILNANSPRIFVNNYDVVMQSIKKNINSVEFAKSEIRNSLPVFRYLVLNNYHFDGTYLKSRTLDYMNDFNVLKKSLKLINKNCYDEKYLEKFAEIYYGVINSKPLIKDFESIFQYIAELKWKEKKEDTIGIYVNVFGKIISELKSASQFEEVFSNLSLLTQEMKNILEEKYDLLYANMLEYYNIFHSQTTNKLQKIEKSRNVISKLSSLYIAKSKENYKKEIMEECNKCIEKYYQLKLTNPYINKMISLPLKKKEFKKLYKGKSQEVCLFLEEISRKYSHSLKNIDVWQLINGFVLNNYSNLEDIIKVPNHFDNYQRFVKASKLINRLNSGYISYDNQELLKYKDIIKFSEDENKYIYTGITFSSNDLEIFKEYLRISKIFAKIKKEIMTKILSMNLKFEYDWKILEELKNNLPFTDEYFEFNQKDIVSLFYFNELLNVLFYKVASFDVSCFDSSTTYSHIYNFLVNNGIIWLLLIKYLASDWFNKRLERFGFYDYNIIDIINNMGRIHEIAELYDFNLNNFADVMLTHDVGINASDRAVAILGFDVILKLCEDTEYTAKSSNEIVKMAEELMCNAVKMSNKTVPYVSGKTMNYQYSLYDWQNSDILLAGIDTKACFRIDGADNDFLHYCILDKNGFVIKITDNFGNFIARASGFRNGNSLYINQLRTVYDIGDNCYVGLMRNECDEIIEVFKLACDDIIKTSHDNQEEKHKIEHIFINRSYAMEYYPSDDINSDVQNYIGDCPMDNYSEDWEEFINSSNNLDCKEDDDYFVTDYGNYPIICISSVKDINSLSVDDLKMYDAKSFYERKRNKVLVTNEFNEETCNKINRIRAIYAHFNDEKYEPINKLNSKIILIGDNWYIIYDGNKIIDSCYILEDERARREFICATEILTNYSTNIDTKNYEVLTNRINEQIKENDAKKLIKTLK